MAFISPKIGTTFSFLLAMAVTIAGGSTLVMMARGWYAHRAVLTGLIVQAALLILNFAAIHYASGLIGSVDGVTPISFWTALYFSVVTWTTIGYGDYSPAPALQLIAALEAAIGYVYLGLIVGIAASRFQPHAG